MKNLKLLLEKGTLFIDDGRIHRVPTDKKYKYYVMFTHKYGGWNEKIIKKGNNIKKIINDIYNQCYTTSQYL